MAGRRPSNAGQYLAHAVGEILLIVAGILLALYIDDWNQDRQQRIHFKNAMERVYNAARDDRGKFKVELASLQAQLAAANELLFDAEGVDDRKLMSMLFYLDSPNVQWAQSTSSAVESAATMIQASPDDLEQLRLLEQVNDYLDAMKEDEIATTFSVGLTRNLITPILVEADIAQSVQPFTQTHWNDYAFVDLTFHTKDELQIARTLLREGALNNPLRTTIDRKTNYVGIAGKRLGLAESLMSSIKKIYPDLRLYYSDISLIGTALSAEGARQWAEMQEHQTDRVYMRENMIGFINQWMSGDVDMNPDPGANNLWSAELDLYDGELKFRSRRTWDENWGGDDFPEGEAVGHGANIRVTRGRYRVELDLDRLTYRFTRLD